MSLSTPIIKNHLTKKQYTNPELIRKTKNDLNCPQWEFNTDQGKVVVQGDISGTEILYITMLDVSLGLKKLEEIDLSAMDASRDVGNTTDSDFFKGVIAKLGINSYKIYAIPSIGDDESYGEIRYESFLIKYDKGNFVWDIHYSEFLLMEDFFKTSRELKGIWIDSDFELEADSHPTMVIPTGSLVTYFHPEYMKVIALSPDLTHGLTTNCFGSEPTVDTLKSDLIAAGFLECDESFFECIDAEDEDEEIRYRKITQMYKDYDFINSNM